MKIYVISDDEEKGAHVYSIVSRLGNNATLNPNFYTDYESVVEDINNQKGAYDLIFIITKSPIPLSAELNKIEWVRAAICNSSEDATDAKKAKSNIFIINNSALTKTNIESIIKNGLSEESKIVQSAQSKLKSIKINGKITKTEKNLQVQQKQKQTEKDESKDESKEYEQRIKKLPFKKRIKLSLGFED